MGKVCTDGGREGNDDYMADKWNTKSIKLVIFLKSTLLVSIFGASLGLFVCPLFSQEVQLSLHICGSDFVYK